MKLDQLKYPIGEFECPQEISSNLLKNWIAEIHEFPKRIALATESLSNEKKNWAYRPFGWTIKQVVHHCADSHMNAFIRFKLALTETNPTIKPYAEDLWAKLIDGEDNDLSYSLSIIKSIHYKWTLILSTMKDTDWEKTYFHPENNKSFSLKNVIGLYAWHCNHHLAHIYQALKHQNSF